MKGRQHVLNPLIDEAAYGMTRKDSEKDSERPHYYSQFWLDVAAGRRIIGGPKPNEEGEPAETEIPEPIPQRRSGREHEASREPTPDVRAGNIVHPVAEPVASARDFDEPARGARDVDQEADIDALEDVDYDDVAAEDEAGIPDMDLGPLDEEDSDEDFFDDEENAEEEEDEEEDEEGGRNWRGRRKAKPARPTKAQPKKPVRRDRRGGY